MGRKVTCLFAYLAKVMALSVKAVMASLAHCGGPLMSPVAGFCADSLLV